MKTTMMKYMFAATIAAAGSIAFAQDEANVLTEANVSATNAETKSAQPEVVNDGGVEVVREAEAAAPVEPPKKVKNAEEEVRAWLKGKKWVSNRWDGKKKRHIRVSAEWFNCEDPAKTENVMVQRDMAVKRAVLKAKAEIIESVKNDMSAEEIVEILGGKAQGISQEAKSDILKRVQTLKQSSSANFIAEMPLFGATCIRQTESWNNGMYQVAIALVWSPALERSARAVLTGGNTVCKPKANGKSIDEWLESINPAFMSGPIQHVDADGKRWFLGVSARAADEGLDAMTLRTNRRIADLSAKQMVAFSLWGDIKASETSKQKLTEVKGKSVAEIAEWLDARVSQAIKGLTIRGMGQLLGEEVEHPVTGGRIYVSIYGVNQDSATDALKVEAMNYATRAELERAKTVERGRAAANKELVENAKDDPKDFKRGYDSQNDALGREAQSRKGTQTFQRNESVQKREKKSQAGVFNGGGDVNDDDL